MNKKIENSEEKNKTRKQISKKQNTEEKKSKIKEQKEKINKIKENKVLKIISNIIYTIVFLIVALLLVAVILQRTSNNQIALGGYRIFIVATGSMEPTYNVGDALVTQEISADEIKVGDDIAYIGAEGGFADKVITHRVISIEKGEDRKICNSDSRNCKHRGRP